MRVLLNQLTALRQRTGVGHYAAQLALTLRFQMEDEDALVRFPGPWIERGIGAMQRLLPSSRPAGAGVFRRHLGRDLLALAFRSTCAMRVFDLYHEPNAIPLPCPRPTVTTVHDLSPILHPEWHPVQRAVHFERAFRDGLNRSEIIITPSETIRQELIRHTGVAATKVTTIGYGVRSAFRPLPSHAGASTLRRLGLPPQFYLAVGTLEPRKNLLMLMRAYCRLPVRIRARAPLVLVGSWGWKSASLATFQRDHGRHLGIIHLGYVSDADLPSLYSSALGLCVPSHYEGFGLPGIEMLACGGAVIASKTPALLERLGRHAAYFDAHDEDGWCDALLRLADDPDWRRQLRQGGRAHVAELTWLRCAGETWSVYRRALGLEKAAVPSRRAA